MRRPIAVLTLFAALAALTLASAAGGKDSKKKPKPVFPATIALPNAFEPEGISIKGNTFYVGSIPTGAVYRGSLVTGKGQVVVPASPGRAAVGLQADHRGRLFVAGALTGRAFVYNARTGADIATYQLTSATAFINDVVVTRSAAWFTDSTNQVLYKLPLGKGGQLPTQAQVQAVPLTGDIHYTTGFNANGIDATPTGKTLVIVQSNEGLLFTVNASTGVTRTIDLGGTRVRNGDGILLDGKRLYVVRNFDNLITVIRLSDRLLRGTVLRQITDTRFDVPTTIDRVGTWLYAVNARFGITVTPDTPYNVVRVRAR